MPPATLSPMIYLRVLFILALGVLNSAYANEQTWESIPDVDLCISKKLTQDNFYAGILFNRLKENEPQAFSSEQCLQINQISQASKKDLFNLYSIIEVNSNYSITKKDKLHFPTEVLVNAGVGHFINQQRYPNQYDKQLHSYAGSAISLGTSSAAYFLVKDSNYSIEEKERIVRYSGPLMSLIVGILKEVAYDNMNRDRHTVDKQDAIATGIGGGAIPIKFEFSF